MIYFSKQYINFFQELSKNNTTAWFNDNRKIYEQHVKIPFQKFIEQLIVALCKHDSEIQIKASDAITRINKDIRFSKDKIPYNLYMGAIISAKGKKDKSYPGIYIQISAESIEIYGGAYALETAALQNVRTYISNNLNEFKKCYTDKKFIETFGEIKGEKNKKILKEFVDAYAKEPLIANKQFYFYATLKVNLITTDTLEEEIINYFVNAKKVNEFLKKALGN